MLEEALGKIHLEVPVLDQRLAHEPPEQPEVEQVVRHDLRQRVRLDRALVRRELKQSEIRVEHLLAEQRQPLAGEAALIRPVFPLKLDANGPDHQIRGLYTLQGLHRGEPGLFSVDCNVEGLVLALLLLLLLLFGIARGPDLELIQLHAQVQELAVGGLADLVLLVLDLVGAVAHLEGHHGAELALEQLKGRIDVDLAFLALREALAQIRHGHPAELAAFFFGDQL